jgi:hypothetical protein
VPTTRYEFRVSGQLTEQALDAVGEFGELQVVESAPETIIYCAAVDRARLHGVLVLLEGLGLHIVEMHQVPDPPVT